MKRAIATAMWLVMTCIAAPAALSAGEAGDAVFADRGPWDLKDRPLTWSLHVEGPEKIGRKNFLQRLTGEILHRGGQGIGGVVDECIKRAAGRFEHLIHTVLYALGAVHVNLRAVIAPASQALAVLFLAARGKDAPSTRA